MRILVRDPNLDQVRHRAGLWQLLLTPDVSDDDRTVGFNGGLQTVAFADLGTLPTAEGAPPRRHPGIDRALEENTTTTKARPRSGSACDTTEVSADGGRCALAHQSIDQEMPARDVSHS